jgi:hypothetical protein
MVQLDFFKTPEECEMDSLRYSLDQVRKSTEKVRKGTYARMNELTKESLDLKARLEILERNICRGDRK